jgi:integrase/recombinase XerD
VRVGEAPNPDIEHLAHDRGHRILRLQRLGGRGDRTVLTAPVVRTIDEYLGGRTTGPLFITKTGRRMDQPEAWRMVRRLARRAALDGAGEIPHSLRVFFITGAREAGVALEDVQDAAGHADPGTTRRYDRGRHSLDRHASYALTSWLDGAAEGSEGQSSKPGGS